MADNVTAPGTGAVFAAELIGGALLVRNKLALGATDVDNGNVSKTNGMPVSGNEAADGSGTEHRLLTDTSGRLLIGPVNGQATMANSRPVAIASDQSAVPMLPNNKVGTRFDTYRVAGGSGLANAITAIDKIATGGNAPNLTAITEAGSNLTNVARVATIAFGNIYGNATPLTLPGTITPTANQAIRIAGPAVPTGCTYVDVWQSTNSPPLYVGRITSSQYTTGDRIFSSIGTPTARGGSTVANTIDVGIQGTGLASNVAPNGFNSAYLPGSLSGSAMPQVDCTGFTYATVYVKLSVTDFSVLPTLNLIPFFLYPGTSDWIPGQIVSNPVLSAPGQSMYWKFTVKVFGWAALSILCDAITGNGASADVKIVLS